MSSYRNIILFIIIVMLSFGCANSVYQKMPQQKEDLTMVLALDCEQIKDYKNSLKYYKILYFSTKHENYLFKSIIYSFKSKQYKIMYDLSNEGLKFFKINKEYYNRNKVIALLGLSKVDQALELALKLVKLNPKAINYNIVANVYYVKKDYNNSLKYYESAYAQKQNPITLIKLTSIMYDYLDKKETALAYLETYVQTNGCDKNICNKLMLIYQEHQNIDGMLSILNRMYKEIKNTSLQNKRRKLIENLIVTLLEKKDIKKAIVFLEKTHVNNTKLLSFYYMYGEKKKALKLILKLYKKTKNPMLLGKIAMYRFEIAKNKLKIMPNVIANFELAIKEGVKNAGYYNYYGYLLIDYDIDPHKGINLVKKALDMMPNNLAFLDSLAWGYYKIGKCKDASIIMNKIVLKIGKSDKEIMKHYNKINRYCKILNKK